MAWDGQILRWEGILLFLGLLGFIYWSYVGSRSLAEEKESEALEYIGGGTEDTDSSNDEGESTADQAEAAEADLAQSQDRIARATRNPLLPAAISGLFRSLLLRDIGMVVIGIAVLVYGADLLVDSATFIARHFGVSELVIGLSLVALGTSLPELAASVCGNTLPPRRHRPWQSRRQQPLQHAGNRRYYSRSPASASPTEYALRRLPRNAPGCRASPAPRTAVAPRRKSLEGRHHADTLPGLYDRDLHH